MSSSSESEESFIASESEVQEDDSSSEEEEEVIKPTRKRRAPVESESSDSEAPKPRAKKYVKKVKVDHPADCELLTKIKLGVSSVINNMANRCDSTQAQILAIKINKMINEMHQSTNVAWVEHAPKKVQAEEVVSEEESENMEAFEYVEEVRGVDEDGEEE